MPLASELFGLVKARIYLRYGRETKFSRDLRAYLAYQSACGHSGQTEDDVDLESFMSYLDIEHYLGFRGSDTWSQEGNESQLMIRRAIGEVIQERTPSFDRLPDVYYRFAERLSDTDTVFSLNYDLVLESALKFVGKPFRRFPTRFESVDKTGGFVEIDSEEVVLLKLHGSIDWFDNRQFLLLKADIERIGSPNTPMHSVFGNLQKYGARQLVDGVLPEDDQLKHIYAIENISEYYQSDGGFNSPFILSPSHIKFVYAEPILSFWRGIGRMGGYNLGVSVIGFSLPQHDHYLRIGLYQIMSNYESWWNDKLYGDFLKDYIRFIDFCPSSERADQYFERYQFVKKEYSKFYFSGFDDGAIDFLFNQNRVGC